MLEKAKQKINKLKKDATIVVAVSSGPDSMALLSLLQQKQFKIIVAHVNHKLRKQSEEEAKYLKEYTKKNNLIFEYMEITKYNGNIESDGRHQRYKFFEELIKKYKADYLLTAHHGDDQIETMLMRIVRGSSLKGYAGIEEVIDKGTYKIVRPLLENTKEEILKYLKQNNIKYYIDETNNSDKITRNRYRKYILPYLKKENKNVHLKFYKLSKELSEINKHLDKEAKELEQDINDLTKFKKNDRIIQKKIIENYLLKTYQENISKITDKHLDNILEMLNNNKPNQIINLPDKINAVKEYNKFYLKKEDNKKPYKIKLEKVTYLPDNHRIEKITNTSSNSNNICRLSLKDVKQPLYIRTKKPGDKLEVKNMKHTKKLKDIFINEKVPKQKRETYPILVDSNDTIIWVPGIKKTKYDKQISENYDIILKYI